MGIEAIPIIDAVGGVRILLDLRDQAARAQSMHQSGGNGIDLGLAGQGPCLGRQGPPSPLLDGLGNWLLFDSRVEPQRSRHRARLCTMYHISVLPHGSAVRLGTSHRRDGPAPKVILVRRSA